MSVYQLEVFLAASKRKLNQQWLNLKESPFLTKQEAYKVSIWGWSSKIVMTSRSWLEKAMAPHSSTFAWKIPWAEEPGRLQSMGS